eukprot:TRINITY_DN10612_c0_g1_i2.p2 TRINITY_DN10612_c0_g1~~TRINITY_DN10612_c0_g1_i2.p2  ORF type:complete len:171 (-),score=8.77 TRINITY_DN10612_c0_g1_i2:39-551(-)
MNFMVGRQTIFDAERQRIGFVPSDCSDSEILSARNSKTQDHIKSNGIPDVGGVGDKESFGTGLYNINENADVNNTETEWRNITDPDNSVNFSETISNATPTITVSGDKTLGVVWTVVKIGGLIASFVILILILIICIRKHRKTKKYYTAANKIQTTSSEIKSMEINNLTT